MSEQATTRQTNAASEETAAETGARNEPSLDELLKEWDTTVEKKPEEPRKEVKPEPKSAAEEDRIAALERHIAEREYADGMRQVVSLVKGDIEAGDDYVEFWVNKQAESDERLQRLWNERNERPREFRQAMEALGREFQKHYQEQFGPKASPEDESRRQISAAALASGSTPATPEDEKIADELASMDDRAFILKKSEIFRHYEKGGR